MGATSRTAHVTPCDSSLFTTCAPMPWAPPVTTAVCRSKFQSLTSFLHNHLFSAQLLSAELMAIVAQRVASHFNQKRMAGYWDSRRGN